MGADQRRIVEPTALCELQLLEASEAEVEENGRENGENGERENHELPRRNSDSQCRFS